MYPTIESYSTTVEIGETQGNIYVEFINDDFHHISYSDALAPYFDKVPVQLLFVGFYKESDMEYVAAGELRDCTKACKVLPKGEGRGRCKFACWKDSVDRTIVKIF